MEVSSSPLDYGSCSLADCLGYRLFLSADIFVGAVAGIIAHDIYDFNDWHRVLIRKEPCEIKK